MARQAIAFSTNEQRSVPLDGARLVNLFPESPPLGARAPALQIGISAPMKAVLYGTPGQKAFVTAGSGKIRAVRNALGYLWALSDSSLYRISSTGTATLCTGTAITPSGDAMMTDNGLQLVVLAGGNSFVAGQTNASFTFRVTSGTYSAGVNKISSITVNAVTITSAAVDWKSSNEQLASDLAANINAYTSVPDYTATANGDSVTIRASTAGTGPNGYAVVITVAGTVTTDTTAGTMAGGSADGTTVAQITSSGYPSAGASSVDFIDGYVIWTEAGSRRFFISSLYDATTIDPLDFASAESTPANLVRVLVDHREVWLLKERGIEVWQNTGASPFPFERISGAVLERGCAAGLSAAKIDNSVFWLGDDLKVYRATGYQPTRISTHGMEDQIRAFSTVSDAFGFTYSQSGHDFYVLTFPTANRTYVFDAATNGFHYRQSGTSVDLARWNVNALAPAFGKIYVGTNAGKVSQLDMDTYTDAGDSIRRVARSVPLFADGRRAVMPEVEIELELGTGLLTGQGSDPQVMLRWSDDGCNTWSNERSETLGARGVRNNRVHFHRLGAFGKANARTLEFSISDPVKVAIYGMSYQLVVEKAAA